MDDPEGEFGARGLRAFADDLCATFSEPARALACAFELCRGMAAFTGSLPGASNLAPCCVGGAG